MTPFRQNPSPCRRGASLCWKANLHARDRHLPQRAETLPSRAPRPRFRPGDLPARKVEDPPRVSMLRFSSRTAPRRAKRFPSRETSARRRARSLRCWRLSLHNRTLKAFPRFMKARAPTTKLPVRSAGVHAPRRKALVRRPKHRAGARDALVRTRKCTPPFTEALAPSRSVGHSSGKRVAPSRKASPRTRKHARSSRRAWLRKTNRQWRAARLPTEQARLRSRPRGLGERPTRSLKRSHRGALRGADHTASTRSAGKNTFSASKSSTSLV